MRHRLKKQAHRALLLEALESRQLLDGSWQNPFNPRDVTGDGIVVPLDVLNTINELNNRVFIDDQGRLPDRSLFPNAPHYDFSGDGKLTDTTGVSRFVAKLDDGPDQTVTVAPDGSFQFNPGLPNDGSKEGEHRVQFVATDGRRNVSLPLEFTFQFDSIQSPAGASAVAAVSAAAHRVLSYAFPARCSCMTVRLRPSAA